MLQCRDIHDNIGVLPVSHYLMPTRFSDERQPIHHLRRDFYDFLLASYSTAQTIKVMDHEVAISVAQRLLSTFSELATFFRYF